ncbi:histone-fold-containing protein [Usnea florida]
MPSFCIKDGLAPLNHAQSQRQLLPKPGTDIPEQPSPSSSSDMENLENLSIAMDPANFRIPRATLQKIMQHAVPPNAKVTKQAVEDMEQYVLEFIRFLTSEAAANKSKTARNILDGDDLLRAMESTGFEHYVLILGPYLEGFRAKKREDREARAQGRAREK